MYCTMCRAELNLSTEPQNDKTIGVLQTDGSYLCRPCDDVKDFFSDTAPAKKTDSPKQVKSKQSTSINTYICLGCKNTTSTSSVHCACGMTNPLARNVDKNKKKKRKQKNKGINKAD